MTKDEIIKMAREAGFHNAEANVHEERLERFAALVAAAEREACAKVCDDRAKGWLEVKYARTIDEGCMHSAAKAEAAALAAAIRARGEK